MALARLGLLKAFLNLSGSVYDEALKAFLIGATAQAEAYTGRHLESATVSNEKHVGTGSRKLYPREYPVTSLTSMTIWDGSAYTAETASYAEIIDGLTLYYPALDQESNATYGAWPSGLRGSGDEDDHYNIRLTYVAGYTTTGWASETVRMLISSLTTAPAVGDVLTQANTGATLTVTAASAADDSITAPITSGTLDANNLDADTFTSNNTGATMAPTPITATRIDYVVSSQLGTVPQDLEMAVMMLAAYGWQQSKQGEGRFGKSGQSVDPFSAQYERYEKGIPDAARLILDQHRRAY